MTGLSSMNLSLLEWVLLDHKAKSQYDDFTVSFFAMDSMKRLHIFLTNKISL